jgi:hypothetical protein
VIFGLKNSNLATLATLDLSSFPPFLHFPPKRSSVRQSNQIKTSKNSVNGGAALEFLQIRR